MFLFTMSKIWYCLLNSYSLMYSCYLVCLLTSKQSNSLKRKLQSPHGNPPSKRKPPINAFKKCATETNVREKGSLSQKSLPKKQLTDNQNESQKSKPFVKTSSLFRNNPDIPKIHRYFTQRGEGKKKNSALKFSVLNSSPCLGIVIAHFFVSLLFT